jgi:hypothetical protein
MIEAMKQALEALETCMYPQQKQMQAITSLRQAIAEAEKQEPVAYRYKMPVEDDHLVWNYCTYPDNKDDPRCEPLYTRPQPKREWVGLTVMEAVELELATNHPREFAAAIEAKLKEKNT